MPTDTAQQTLILQLRTEIDRLYDCAANPSGSPFRKKYEEVAALWDKLRSQVDKSNRGEIADFFDAIGSGVIGAQKRLDRASEAYVASTLRQQKAELESGTPATEVIAPNASMFRIPRVTAELKCSIETNRDKKLNLVFYSDRTDVKELHQQTISLEVVAVPVPPDYLNQLRARAYSAAPASDVDAAQASDADTSTSEDAEDTPQPGNRPQIFSLSASAERQPLSLSDEADAALAPRVGEETEDEETEDEETDDRVDPEPAGRSRKEAFQTTHIDLASDSQISHMIPILDGAGRSMLSQTLLAARERDEVLTLILQHCEEEAQPAQDDPSPTRSNLRDVRNFLIPSWNRVLLFASGPNVRFLLLATTDKRPRLLLWQLQVQPLSLHLLYKLPKQKDEQKRLRRLQRFVEELGQQQDITSRSEE